MDPVQQILKTLAISAIVQILLMSQVYSSKLGTTKIDCKPGSFQPAYHHTQICEIFKNRSNLFSGVKNIDLSFNRMKNLPENAFNGADQATILNLSYNQLQKLPLGVFDPLTNVEVLDLKGNNLISLKNEIFNRLLMLRYLDLSSNDIGRDLRPDCLFCRNKMIEFLDFSSNDLSLSDTPENLLDGIENLKFLYLNRCHLKEVPRFATNANLSTMKHLTLSTNEIREINEKTIFDALENLEILDLADNVIEDIVGNVFKPLKKLRSIVLKKNKLSFIPNALFTGMAELTNIDLSHNLIEFLHLDAFRGTKVKNLNLADNQFTYLPDNFLLELKNSGVTVTKFYFHQNYWQCACLRDVLNEVKSLEVQYDSVDYDGKQPVCVIFSVYFNWERNALNRYAVSMFENQIIDAKLKYKDQLVHVGPRNPRIVKGFKVVMDVHG